MNIMLRHVFHAALVIFSLAPGASFAVKAPTINASGYLLIDVESRQALSEHNADARLEPASLTKIMTAHVVFSEIKAGRISLQDMVLISEKAWKMKGSKMFIEVNKEVTVEKLLKGLIIQSGNDAAVALAEHVAGSEEAFAELMNKHAAQLGMNGTNFANASGMPNENHYTTPRDIALVTESTILEFPEYYKWYAEKEYTFNKITQSNRNRLLWQDESVDGVKTGHTQAAGYCLVSSAKRDGSRLVAVIMGTKSDSARVVESRKLLNWGFRFFETSTLFKQGDEIKSVRIWKGEADNLSVGVGDDILIRYPRDLKDKLKAKLSMSTPLVAPVSKGERVGSIDVMLEDDKLKTVPLIALEEVKEAGIFGWLVDTLLLWFEE
ncbi:MAG TPA: serine-type D-Ala-D-Ala carboxypeptidase [Gammaproteobacteria bacterium]|nr:serine-type D-Ala-D-Ala carboxypeptidase [Gammaproteobacteria bacterium]